MTLLNLALYVLENLNNQIVLSIPLRKISNSCLLGPTGNPLFPLLTTNKMISISTTLINCKYRQFNSSNFFYDLWKFVHGFQKSPYNLSCCYQLKYLQCLLCLQGSVTRLGDLLDFGRLYQSMRRQLVCPKSPIFLGNFCKGAKIFNFSSEISWATFIDIWRIFTGHTASGPR